MIERCCAEQEVRRDQLVLHSDNGGAMKGNTMLAKLQQLGVMASFSRPRVSSDNAFAESVFRTLKYRASYPFATRERVAESMKQRAGKSSHSRSDRCCARA